MFDHLISPITHFITSPNAHNYIPYILFGIGFLDTVGFIGLFMPFEIPAIIALGRFVHEPEHLLFSAILLGAGVFCGLLTGYFLGKTFLRNKFEKLLQKFPYFEHEFSKADKMAKNHSSISFPIMINIGILRSLISVYFGSHDFDYKKYIFSSGVATIAYVIPRVLIGILGGEFGHHLVKNLKLDAEVIGAIVILAIIIGIFRDFNQQKKHSLKALQRINMNDSQTYLKHSRPNISRKSNNRKY